MEKLDKNTQFGHFGCHVPVQFELVPVQFRYWSFLANLYRYMLDKYGTTAALFPVSTSFGILAITCSFLIRFE